MANSFRNFKNVLTAINFMKKKVSSRHSMKLIKEAQFDPVMDMLESKDWGSKSIYKNAERILGQGLLNIRNHTILAPLKVHSEGKTFFTKRMKSKNKRKVKRWLTKINKAETPIVLRKILTRMSQRRRSMPHAIQKVSFIKLKIFSLASP